MSNYKAVEKLKKQLEEEVGKPVPDMAKVQKLKNQIIMIGMAIGPRDIKPF